MKTNLDIDRFRGCLLGLAVGDALGTTLEFNPPGTFEPIADMVGGGPFGLQAGQWTDDTSMALCIAESLIETGGFDPADQMHRFVRWWREGHLSSTGNCFDIGNTIRAALMKFEATGEPFSGGTHPHSAGNGSIMRLAPVPLFFAGDPEAAMEMAGESSRTTHGLTVCVDACRYMAGILVGALNGVSKEEILSPHYSPVAGYWDRRPLCPEIEEIAAGSFKDRQPPKIKGSGYVVKSLEAALWAFYHTADFRAGVLKAVNLGDDADTTGAVFGQIAGAYYGASGIPSEWLKKLCQRELIEALLARMVDLCRHGFLPGNGSDCEKPSPSNITVLEELFVSGEIKIRRGALFDQAPVPMPANFDFNRVEGMLLGLAIGDALGNTTEGMLPGQRRQLYGEIRDYLPNRYAGGSRRGTPTDDTQLAFWTLESLIAKRGLTLQDVAERFCSRQIFGIGGTVRRFIGNFKAGRPWHESGVQSAGNGALMRIAPVLLPHLKTGSRELWADAALGAMLTHNDTASISSCVAFVYMLWELLQMEAPPDPEWWPTTYCQIATQLENETVYSPRSGQIKSFQGALTNFIQEYVLDAHERNLSVADACRPWYSGAFLLETVPGVIYILMRHAHDPEEAIVRAVNDTKDNDTYAAIVGAAVGALHGAHGLPRRWVAGLTGRTGAADDKRIFELIAEAKDVFWPGRRA